MASFTLLPKQYELIVKSAVAIQGLAGKNTFLRVIIDSTGLRIQSIDDKQHRSILLLKVTPDKFEKFVATDKIEFGISVVNMFPKQTYKFTVASYEYTIDKLLIRYLNAAQEAIDTKIPELSEDMQTLVNAMPETDRGSIYLCELSITNKDLHKYIVDLEGKFLMFQVDTKDSVATLTLFCEVGEEKHAIPIETFLEEELVLDTTRSIKIDLDLFRKTLNKIKTLNKVIQIHYPSEEIRPIRFVIETAIGDLNYYCSPFE